jgi:pimeloyl-ACP methyl ester carboxylesterase
MVDLPEGVRARRVAVNGVELDVLEAGSPSGVPVILSHGFPEGAWSWRHTLPAVAAAGFHAIAPDQRGYGGSSCPNEVSAYGIGDLSADLIGLVEDAGADKAVFVGHDWGALIVWDLARLHPERVQAVVGVSVPAPVWPAPPTQLMRAVYGDSFFYILYFQEVGPAEAELEADTRAAMARFLWSASGDAWTGEIREPVPAAGAKLLEQMSDPPEVLPAWLTRHDIEHFGAQFERSGFFGPISYYRNLDANYERLTGLGIDRLTMPSYFITGDRDLVIAMDPNGIDRMKATLPDFRGATVLPGIGHWTQQEAPDAFNTALVAFLHSL